jgi:hypothetical protein
MGKRDGSKTKGMVVIDPRKMVREADQNDVFDLTVASSLRPVVISAAGVPLVGFVVLIAVGAGFLTFSDQVLSLLVGSVIAPAPILLAAATIIRAVKSKSTSQTPPAKEGEK